MCVFRVSTIAINTPMRPPVLSVKILSRKSLPGVDMECLKIEDAMVLHIANATAG